MKKYLVTIGVCLALLVGIFVLAVNEAGFVSSVQASVARAPLSCGTNYTKWEDTGPHTDGYGDTWQVILWGTTAGTQCWHTETIYGCAQSGGGCYYGIDSHTWYNVNNTGWHESAQGECLAQGGYTYCNSGDYVFSAYHVKLHGEGAEDSSNGDLYTLNTSDYTF